MFERFRHFIGTSIGALISFLLALGFSCREMEDYGMTEDFASLMDIDLGQALTTMGLNSGESLESRLRDIAEERMGVRAPTLAQVAAFRGLDLSVVATCLETASVELLSSAHPGTAGLDAVRCVAASMRLPGIFAPDTTLLPGKTLVDGGPLCNFPIGLALDRFPGQRVFGVKIVWKDPGPGVASTSGTGVYMERINRAMNRPQERQTFESIRSRGASKQVLAVESGLSLLAGTIAPRRRAQAIREAQTSARRDLRTLRETGLPVADVSGRTAVARFGELRQLRRDGPAASPEEVVGAMVLALAAAAVEGTSFSARRSLLPTKHGRRRNSWTTFSRPLTSTPAPPEAPAPGAREPPAARF